MDEQKIIIDDVDVKDCKRRIGKDNYCRYYKRPCAENNFNCIWKKYLRKEQECEELKEALNEGCLHNLTLMTEQRVLLQTLTEIKEIAESEIDSKEFMAIQCMLNGSVDNKNKVLKQILQKINEVENGTNP